MVHSYCYNCHFHLRAVHTTLAWDSNSMQHGLKRLASQHSVQACFLQSNIFCNVAYSVSITDSRFRTLAWLRGPKLPNWRFFRKRSSTRGTHRCRFVQHEYAFRFHIHLVLHVLQAFKVWPRSITDHSGTKLH